MERILIIIVVYNGLAWLERCLTSIDNSTIDSDIIIIDNGSTDGSREYISAHYPNVKLILSEHNLGFGAANNIGIKFALQNNYSFIYLLNQDAWLEKTTLETLIDVSRNNPQYGILSPLQLNANCSKLDSNFTSCCTRELVSDAICKQRFKPVYAVNFVMAAHWLITRTCVERVGAFSPTFYHYGEDSNYVDRARYHGFKIGIVPIAKAVHDRGERVISVNDIQRKLYTDSLVTLSNPIISKRILRVCGRYVISYLKNRKHVKFSTFIKLMRDLKAIRNNRKISLSKGAFLNN